jgi:hypothetical protein
MKLQLITILTCFTLFSLSSQERVGIGETNPNGKLHIKHNSSLGVPQLRITEDQRDYARIKLDNTAFPNLFWDIAGLTDTTANGGKLNFYFYNGSFGRDLMSINQNGNVGIGIVQPTEKLDINGSLRIRSLAGSGDRNLVVDQYGKMKIGTLGAGDTDWAEYSNIISSQKQVLMNGPSFNGSNVSTMILNNTSISPPPLYFETGTRSYYDANEINAYQIIGSSAGGTNLGIQNQSPGNVTLVQGGGIVGIGTSPFDAKLHVMGSDNNGTVATLKVETAGNGQVLLFDGNEIDVTGNVNTLAINSNSGHPVSIGSHAVPAGYKLSVDGKIVAEELLVQLKSNWPDYVFTEDYALTPIDELAKQINKLGHLPGMPSAKEVESKGQEVGNMQVKLVEKIEELTLYVIELKAEIETLKSKIESHEK